MDGILCLNLDSLNQILLRLSLPDLISVGQTCKMLHGSLNDEISQHELCQHRWGSMTNVREWRPKTSSYLGVYRLLHSLEPFVGCWRDSDSQFKGHVFTISWSHGHLDVSRLVCGERKLQTKPLAIKLGPSHPHVKASLVNDGQHVVIKELPRSKQIGIGKSAAEAAEAASITLSPANAITGTSPPSSFCYEFASFMSSSVQRRRSETKKLSGSLGNGSFNSTLATHAWSRLRHVSPRHKNQPLTGLWYGLCPTPGFGMFLISVNYDTSKSAAHIVGNIKSDGADLSVDLDLFIVSASPLSQPWSEKDQLLIESRHDSRRRRLGLASDASDPLAFLQLGGDSDDDRGPAEDDEEEEDEEMRVNQNQKHVVAVFSGKGRVMEGGGPRWVEGRIWMCECGSFAFVFLSSQQHLQAEVIGPAAGGAWEQEEESSNTIIEFKRWIV